MVTLQRLQRGSPWLADRHDLGPPLAPAAERAVADAELARGGLEAAEPLGGLPEALTELGAAARLEEQVAEGDLVWGSHGGRGLHTSCRADHVESPSSGSAGHCR